MAGVVLQFGDLGPAGAALVASELLAVALGLTISYIAYRGYRRNDARSMLFVSLGFVLVVGVPSVAGGAALLLPVPELAAAAVSQTAEVAGMAGILHGLRTAPE